MMLACLEAYTVDIFTDQEVQQLGTNALQTDPLSKDSLRSKELTVTILYINSYYYSEAKESKPSERTTFRTKQTSRLMQALNNFTSSTKIFF